MEINACVKGFGPFKKELVECLDYHSDDYKETEEGVLVTTTFFECHTTHLRQLAEIFGIDDPWDFNKHHIKSLRPTALRKLLDFSIYLQDITTKEEAKEEEVDKFLKCCAAGFTFIYCPNG